MAVYVGHADERRLARRALNRADELLGEVERLQLGGYCEVPAWCKDSATAVGRAATRAGVRDPRLETDAGVIKLMDDVFTLEERLMRRLRRQNRFPIGSSTTSGRARGVVAATGRAPR